MWVESREVEFAGVQEEHGVNRGDPTISARPALGGLERAVQNVQESVGLACLRLDNDPREVTADQPAAGHRADANRQRFRCSIQIHA